jgi:hypothetical protein
MNVQLCPVGIHTNNPSPTTGVRFLKIMETGKTLELQEQNDAGNMQ